jgi:hypothetical protein
MTRQKLQMRLELHKDHIKRWPTIKFQMYMHLGYKKTHEIGKNNKEPVQLV